VFYTYLSFAINYLSISRDDFCFRRLR